MENSEEQRSCAVTVTREEDDGGGHYWHCAEPGTVPVDGKWLCEDHAGAAGYGPKQADYGFDPEDRADADLSAGLPPELR